MAQLNKDTIEDYLSELQSDLIIMNSKIKILDKMVLDFYHAIEVVHIDHISKSHNLFIELQKILKDRRNLKNERSYTQSLFDTLHTINNTKFKNIKSNINRVETESKKSLEKILIQINETES